jgi:hypothetical protein
MSPIEFREMASKMRLHPPQEMQKPQIQQMPSIPQMAMNLVKDGAKWIHGGMKFASEGVAQQRIDICNKCEFYVGSRCSKCGCQMRVKTTLATSSCPIGKWGAVSETPASSQNQTSPPAS